jgi:hypothetical protein
MNIVYVDRAKFKAHITTKKHKIWLKNKIHPQKQLQSQPQLPTMISTITKQMSNMSINPINPITHITQTNIVTEENTDISISTQTDIVSQIQPRYYAPKVSHLIYFMKWTVNTQKIMREIEERIILKE